MLEIAFWLLASDLRPGPTVLPIWRVKNKFTADEHSLLGGYSLRDLMLCWVVDVNS
jgi:hypothetical protein